MASSITVAKSVCATDPPDDSRRQHEQQETLKQARKSIVNAPQQVRVLLRRRCADKIAHQDPEIESGHVYEQSFEDVRVMPQMCSSHASRFQVVREGPLQEFASLSE